MANVRSGNSFYVDSASAGATPASFINLPQLKVASIMLTGAGAGDTITLADLNSSTLNSAGSTKLTIKVPAANDTKFINLFDYPMVFANGLWVSVITAGATATIVIITPGS